MTDIAWGSGYLEFEKVGTRTVVSRVFAKSPLRLLTPKNAGMAAWVYTSSFGGGIVGGDALKIEVRVRSGARAVLLSQSSNKVYRSEIESSQTIEATVESGATLWSMPDPTVCFEGARFTQKQIFELEVGASLLLVDTFHCGRGASGERWLFEKLKNRIEVREQGRRIFVESLLLDKKAGKVAERIGRFNVFSLLLLHGPVFSDHADRLMSAIADEPLGKRGDLLVATSPILGTSLHPSGKGALVRIAGVSTEEVNQALRSYLRFVPEDLGDNPWARKW